MLLFLLGITEPPQPPPAPPLPPCKYLTSYWLSYYKIGNVFLILYILKFSVTQGGLTPGCPSKDNFFLSIENTQDMIPTNQTGAVRCCSFDGGSCKSETPDCSKLTASKAYHKCAEFEMRLCSEQELSSNICCGTGCLFDEELVWYTKGSMFCSNIKILMQLCPNGQKISKTIFLETSFPQKQTNFFEGLLP